MHKSIRTRRRVVPVLEGLEVRRLLAYTFDFVPLATHYDDPSSIVSGPDGNVWFTTSYVSYLSDSKSILDYATISELNPTTGSVSIYPTPTGLDQLGSIIVGPGGNLWFTDDSGLGSISPTTHVISQYSLGIANAKPTALTLGPDGNLWFTDPGTTSIGVFNPLTDQANEFPLPKSTDTPSEIVAGPDGNLWFTIAPKNAIVQYVGSGGAVGNINPTTHAFSLFPTQTAAYTITTASDGNLWFSEAGYPPPGNGYYVYLTGKINPRTDALNEVSSDVYGYTTAPDGNLWYGNGIGSILELNVTTMATTTILTVPNLSNSGGAISGRNGLVVLLGTRVDGSNVSTGNTEFVIATPIPSNQAVLSGYVYLDPAGTPGNGGMSPDGGPNNPAQAGQTVFVDLKNDGTLDPGDPVTNTDGFGYYTFTGLTPGTYTVRIVPYPGALATYPGGGAGQTITVAGGALGAVGPLGVLPVSTVMPLTYNLTPFGIHNADVQTAEVNGLYQIILGRAPDAAGGAAAVSFLKNGGAIRQIVDNLFGSAEYDSDVVTSYYHDFLNRAPDAAGGAAAVSYLQHGGSLTGLATILLNSAEFNALFPANATFVQALYGDILGRLPSVKEVAGWLGTFTAGATRSEVVTGFLTSTEATTNAVGWLYATIFARSPDANGQPQAFAALAAGMSQEDLAKASLSSAEFIARANATVG